MDKQTLIARLAHRTADKITIPNLTALGEDPGVQLPMLHEICYDKQHPTLAFRAAWLLEYIASYHPERFSVVINRFLTRFSTQENPSCQRHFTKILSLIIQPNAPSPYQTAYLLADREQLVETVFSWLIDPQTPVAVQANCMDILFHMRSEFEWIGEELRQQITFLLRDGSAAIQSRGKKILGKLKPN